MMSFFSPAQKSNPLNHSSKNLAKSNNEPPQKSFAKIFSELSKTADKNQESLKSSSRSNKLKMKENDKQKVNDLIKKMKDQGKSPAEILNLISSFAKSQFSQSETNEFNQLFSKLDNSKIDALKTQISDLFGKGDLATKQSENLFAETEKNILLVLADELNINLAEEFNLSEKEISDLAHDLIYKSGDYNLSYEDRDNALNNFINKLETSALTEDLTDLNKNDDKANLINQKLESSNLSSIGKSDSEFNSNSKALLNAEIKDSVEELSELLAKLESDLKNNKLTAFANDLADLEKSEADILSMSEKKLLVQEFNQKLNSLLKKLDKTSFIKSKNADLDFENIENKIKDTLALGSKNNLFEDSQNSTEYLNSLNEVLAELKSLEKESKPKTDISNKLNELNVNLKNEKDGQLFNLNKDNLLRKNNLELLVNHSQKGETDLNSKEQDTLFQHLNIAENQGNDLQTGADFKLEGSKDLYSKVDLRSQIAEKFEGSYSADKKELQIQLEPKSLGKVDVSLSYDNDKIVGKMIVESEIIRSQLEDIISGLKKDLVKQGINIEQFKIETAKNSPQQVEKNNNFFFDDQQSAFSDGDTGHNTEHDQRSFFQGLYYTKQAENSNLSQSGMINSIKLDNIEIKAKDSIDLLA
ncbi:MAG: flagellar hook-length control protein-like protein [Halanaerobium sp.]|nr:MAG: flagellar hook-length control protein-like protein [Halanaerobium sp.]